MGIAARKFLLASLIVVSFCTSLKAQDQVDAVLTRRVEALEKEVKKLKKQVKYQTRQLKQLARRFQAVSKAAGGRRLRVEMAEGVSQEKMKDILNSVSEHAGEFRTVPYFRDGKSIGLRLFAVREGSVLKGFGLRNGDILLSVDGQRVTSAENLDEMLFGKTYSSFRQLLIERGGAQMRVKVPITGKPNSILEKPQPESVKPE
jgi:membrane-associated protease RseP (regulator of RpoE activity)